MRSIETKMKSVNKGDNKEFYLQYTKIISYISYALYKTVASNELGVEQTPDEYEYKSYLKKPRARWWSERVVAREGCKQGLKANKYNYNDNMHNMLLLQPDSKQTKQV
ncbi:hypothetical protein GQX74_006180 [Glossina fuscipes]|nr:hypothetical protein GQX74_006180 [Glossina fuscipes]